MVVTPKSRARDAVLARMKTRLDHLRAEEVIEIAERIADTLEETPQASSPVVSMLSGNRTFSPTARAALEYQVLMRSFERRRHLLADSITAPKVAALLATSRQTPHDRLGGGTLLAVKDGGVQKFPLWQFDPDGEDGIVQGLPAVLKALHVSPLAKVSWLTRPNAMLDGEMPLALLKAGETERVLRVASAVGIA